MHGQTVHGQTHLTTGHKCVCIFVRAYPAFPSPSHLLRPVLSVVVAQATSAGAAAVNQAQSRALSRVSRLESELQQQSDRADTLLAELLRVQAALDGVRVRVRARLICMCARLCAWHVPTSNFWLNARI